MYVLAIGFRDKVLRIVEKNDDVARITIFTDTSVNGSVVTFTTFSENATEGNQLLYVISCTVLFIAMDIILLFF